MKIKRGGVVVLPEGEFTQRQVRRIIRRQLSRRSVTLKALARKIFHVKYLVILFALLLLFPLYWMVKGSLENISGMMKVPPRWLPVNPTLETYKILFDVTMIGRWFANTLLISTAGLLFSLTSNILAAYAFAIYKFHGKQLIYWLFLASLMIPGQSLLVSKFILMKYFGWINTWYPLIFLGGCAPVAIILLKKYIAKIPGAMLDSARIDGLNELGILFRIMLPQCKPILGFMLITSYMGAFSQYLWPLVMIQERANQVLAVGIIESIRVYFHYGYTLQVGRELSLSLAGGVILLIPVILIFLAFQRTFRQDFMAGGVKE